MLKTDARVIFCEFKIEGKVHRNSTALALPAPQKGVKKQKSLHSIAWVHGWLMHMGGKHRGCAFVSAHVAVGKHKAAGSSCEPLSWASKLDTGMQAWLLEGATGHKASHRKGKNLP